RGPPTIFSTNFSTPLAARFHNFLHTTCRSFRGQKRELSGHFAPILAGGHSCTVGHRGALFLDELPEYPAAALEALREPLEDGRITISRAGAAATYPARTILVAAMNPCACGFFGDAERECRCLPDQVARYRGRISGPLLDRIDLRVGVPRVQAAALRSVSAEPSHAI